MPVTVDLLKNGGEVVLVKLAALYRQCLKTASIPESWKDASVILIHKKRGVKDLKNYRPTSLLPAAYNIFTKATGNRFRETLDFNQPRNQASFLKGYSTIDHIHTINQVIEKFAEYNQRLYIALINYEEAFDSVETSAVVEA